MISEAEEKFCAGVAGVPFSVTGPETAYLRTFLADYLSAEEPELSIVLTEGNIQAEEEKFRTEEPQAAETMSSEQLRQLAAAAALHRGLSEALIAGNVLLMHGSALEVDGEAFIFTAPSGTGKSTHARMWRQRFGGRVRMINDDKPFLRFETGRILVCGSPWSGKHRLDRPVMLPLKAVAFLERGPENRIEPLPPGEALTRLLRQVYLPASPEKLMRVLEFADRMSQEAAMYRLECLPDEAAAQLAYEVMSGQASAERK